MVRRKRKSEMFFLNLEKGFTSEGQACKTCYGRGINFLLQRHYPVDTGRKLNVHKTFRRRPGRLLNVLCTFNLRPVSTG